MPEEKFEKFRYKDKRKHFELTKPREYTLYKLEKPKKTKKWI